MRQAAGARQHHAALVGGDGAGVVDLGRDQHHGAAFFGGDLALVGHCGFALAAQVDLAGHEVFVVHVERRGNEAADIDLGPSANEHAVGVDQEHMAVGAQAAHDLAAFGAGDAVERGGGVAWLVEAHRFVGRHGEAAPVDDGAVRALVDGGGFVGAADAGRSAYHVATFRTGMKWGAHPQQGGGYPQHQPTQAGLSHSALTADCVEQTGCLGFGCGLAAPFGDFRDGLPAGCLGVPDNAVEVVHGVPGRFRFFCQ